ncbi:uncharacterized protein Z518_06597 [Rhinocladiella mackenziei CBS 650.93]|uniref:Uncharacterized protein n=1 Tax=Rhinocladiella mackenziei CBS 650.93 TaxID=1442369 RepID=A0A0D2FM70_9EURO|nr:uncharacterized protein Z518_06597 [Rhinocladiella mackenziei CBS 650.93]KIX03047.1 hypothetical protein Z518_06597 [Rhinocladiella mackenziei CBS 650.93]
MSSTILPIRVAESFSTPPLPQFPLTPPPSDQSLKTQDLSTGKSRKQKQGKQKGKHQSRTGLEAIIEQVEKRKIGRGFFAVPWLRFKLSPTEFEHFEQHYQEDGFVQDKLRYDYFPSAHLFVLRMPCLVHEYLAASVKKISQQLDMIATRADSTGEFARNIGNLASTTIRFNDPTLSKHSPDGSFRHNKAKYPGVVIEVSYSQKKRDLPRLADDYILGSDAKIRAVVGLDLDYGGKMATVSIWRPRIQVNAAGEKELVSHKRLPDQEFRSEDGNEIGDPQAGLRLRLGDFASKVYADGSASLDNEIFISAHDLFTYLNKAEGFDRPFGVRPDYEYIEPGTRKRARESTPPGGAGSCR